MLLGATSVQDLNGRLEKSVSINRFRPNIIAQDTDKAFAEVRDTAPCLPLREGSLYSALCEF